MPKELLEIKNFTLGTQTTPSETDISHEAASYSLNVDPIAQDGKLQAIPDDTTKEIVSGANWANATGNQAEMMRVIEVDGVKHIITYVSDGRIRYSHSLTTSSPANALADVTGTAGTLTANLQNGDNIDMEVNNQEVHIGLGTSNDAQWVGKIAHNQFGTPYETTHGIYRTDAELKSPSQFKSCYKWIWTQESGTNYVHGIEYKGNRVYRFKENTAGASYSFVSASATRFESTQGICARFATGTNETAQTATLWVFDGGAGESGILYAYDPINDLIKKTFPISHTWTNDTDHTYISDIIELQANTSANNARVITFSKHYENEYPIVHKDYYSGNTGDLNNNYGQAGTNDGGDGIGILYGTMSASHQGSSDVDSQSITLFKTTPTLFWDDGQDDKYTTGMPYHVGTGTGYKGWTYLEPYFDLSLGVTGDYSKRFLGGIVGSVGAGDNAVVTGSNYGHVDDSRYLATLTCTMDAGDWGDIHNNYANCRFINSILNLYPVTTSGTLIRGSETEFAVTASAASETPFASNMMMENICIDSTNKLIFFTQKTSPGVGSDHSILSAVKYTINDSRGSDSGQYGISLAIANSTEANITEVEDAGETTRGDEYGEVVCDPSLKIVVLGRGSDGVELLSYAESGGNWTFTSRAVVSADTMFGGSGVSKVHRIKIDTENQVVYALGGSHTGSDVIDSTYHVLLNYSATTLAYISSGNRLTNSHTFPVTMGLDASSKLAAFHMISDGDFTSRADGLYITLVGYDLTGDKGSYSAVSFSQDFQFYKDPDGGMIPIDIHVDGANNLMHTTERHNQGLAYNSTNLVTPTLVDGREYFKHALTGSNDSATPFNSSSNGYGDTVSGAGGDAISCFGNTMISSWSIVDGKVGEHIQSFTWNETNNPSLAHGQMTFTNDGKYMFVGGTADSRSILFTKRNINNKNAVAGEVSKGIFTHAQVQFQGAGSFELSGSLMGKVVLDENYHILFAQDINTNAIKAYMYCTDDDYRITTPKANLVALRAQSGSTSSTKGVGLLWKTAHPFGTPFQFASGDGTVAKWWLQGVTGNAVGYGVSAISNSINAQPNGSESVVRCLEWTNGTPDRLYDANVIGVANITDPDGIVDANDDSKKRIIAVFSKKSDTETYLTTYQKRDEVGPNFPTTAYSNTVISFDTNESINDGNLNIPKAMGALRFDATGNLSSTSDLFALIASSKSGTALTATLKVDGNSYAANPADSGSYDPTGDDIAEGPTANAFLDNSEVISTGGTLKFNYKYFYKLTFVYDGYQESPLGDDLQVETTYASSDYTDGVLDSTAEAITANTISIKLDINLNSTSLDKRVSSVKLYRAESTNVDASEPEGFYRLVKEISLNEGWLEGTSLGNKPDFTANREQTITDTGSSFQNFEANTGISEVIDSYNIKYKCSTQLNNTHFVGNCTTGLDSSLLGSNYIAKSKPYNFDQFNVLTDVLQVSGTVVAMASFAGRIFAFSETKVFKIEPNNLFIEDTWEGMGTFNQKSVFVSDYGMCWCDKNNIYLWDGRQVKTIGDAILKGDSTNSWQEGSLVYTPATDSAASMEPQVFWDPERKAFLIMFTSDTNHRKIWAYSVAKNRWDLWDIGSGAQVQSFVHGPSGEVFYVKYGSTNLFWLNGHATTRKPLSWHSKKLTMGMDTQVKLFKKVRITGFDGVDENVLNSDVNVSFLTAAGNPENSNEFSDGTTQSVYSLSTSAAKSEWLKVKIDAAENDNLQIDSIGIIYRRRPIR